MLKIPSKYGHRYFIRPTSFPSPVHPALLLDYSAGGRNDRELWWGNREFSPVDIPLWLSMLIYALGDKQ
jgi:hypothetical protein